MLRVVRLTDRTGRYYLADLATELEISEEGPAARGAWRGTVAAGLGLTGPVGGDDLRAVLSGRHPATGRPLSVHATAVAGFDLTCSAPKSVSVLFAMSDPRHGRDVLEAHRAAVDSALSYAQTHMVSVRRGSGDDRRVEACRGVIAAAFTHGVSRALDPHLHTHVVVANLTQGVDGRWTALDGRAVFAHAQAIGALYDASLRHELSERLGVSWRPRQHGGYDLDAVDPVLIGALSTRSAQIRSHLHEHAAGRPGMPGHSARARAVAWAVTRDPKDGMPTAETLRSLWHQRASDAGWSGRIGPSLAQSHSASLEPSGGPSTARRAALDEHRFTAALVLSGSGAVTRRDVIAAWAGAVHRGVPAADVGQCVDALGTWGPGVGVAERAHPVGAVIARPHVLRALGPRPCAPSTLARWLRGAAAIEHYRDRWVPRGSHEPLGVPSGADATSGLAAMPVRRLAEHLSVSRELADIRRQLGRDVGRDVGREPLGIERSL